MARPDELSRRYLYPEGILEILRRPLSDYAVAAHDRAAVSTHSNIIRSFNDLSGNISWTDTDRIGRLIATEIPDKVAANAAYQNAKQNSDRQNARIEHDKALSGVIVGLMKDDTELFKQFSGSSRNPICRPAAHSNSLASPGPHSTAGMIDS